MSKFKILIPTDFSGNARAAIDYAMNHFRQDEVEFIVAHLIEQPPSRGSVLLRLDDLMRKDAEDGMAKEVHYIKTQYQVDVKTEIKMGDLKSWLGRHAEMLGLDLVVMGTKGKNNVESKIFGSNTEGLIRVSKVPVLAIPSHCPIDKDIEHVVFANEKGEIEDSAFVTDFLNHLKLVRPKVDVLTVVKDENTTTTPRSVPFNGLQIGVEVVNSDSAVDGINDYLEEHDVDILGVNHHHNSTLDYLFNRSVTRSICAKTHVPILVMK
jgi:nucleotide-binding universal stress UspA family protein